MRFTYRNNAIRIYVLDIGEKGGRHMKKKIKDSEEPMGNLRVVKDFLPPPDQLVPKEENVKVTIAFKKIEHRLF